MFFLIIIKWNCPVKFFLKNVDFFAFEEIVQSLVYTHYLVFIALFFHF